jgi:ketosteroid isomerase-like protein
MDTDTHNRAFVERAYQAMASGDIPWMQEHTADDVLFRQNGRFPTAGTYQGRDAMLGHFMEFMTLVDGNFSIDAVDLLTSEDRVAALIKVTIGKDGRELTFDEVHLWRVQDDRLVEMEAIPFSPYVVDEFFAATS